MLDFILESGKRLVIEDCGDSMVFKMFDENGEYEHEVAWDASSIADMVFE